MARQSKEALFCYTCLPELEGPSLHKERRRVDHFTAFAEVCFVAEEIRRRGTGKGDKPGSDSIFLKVTVAQFFFTETALQHSSVNL